MQHVLEALEAFIANILLGYCDKDMKIFQETLKQLQRNLKSKLRIKFQHFVWQFHFITVSDTNTFILNDTHT